MHCETVWSFKTARIRVALEVAPEDMAPDFDDQEAIDDIASGRVEWFQARVSVYADGYRIAADYLGGCAYSTVAQFYTSHRDADPLNRNCSIMRAAKGANVCIGHYFPDMVSSAIHLARAEITRLKSFPLREAA